MSSYGTCSACAKGCLSCDSDEGCLTCGVGYIKVSDENDISSCEECPEKCSTCEQKLVDEEMKNMCTLCQNGYTPQEDGKCLSCGQTKKTYGCEVCTKHGTCRNCLKGLSLQEDGICRTDDYIEGDSVWSYIYIIIGLSVVVMLLLSTIFILS